MSRMSRRAAKPPRLPHREIEWTTNLWITLSDAEPPEDRVHPPDAKSIRVGRSPPAGRPEKRSDRRTSATEPCSRGPSQPTSRQSQSLSAVRRRTWLRRGPGRRVAFGLLHDTN